jgi:hypothetical protein
MINNMVVDEERIHILTKYSTKAGEKKIVESDHHMLILETNIQCNAKKKNERVEIFNFNLEEGKAKYKSTLENENALVNCFKTEESFEIQAIKWFRKYIKIINRSFPKIRITGKPFKGILTDKLQKVKELKKNVQEATKNGSITQIHKAKDDLQNEKMK